MWEGELERGKTRELLGGEGYIQYFDCNCGSLHDCMNLSKFKELYTSGGDFH